jgi:uncharacterized protein
MKRFRRHARVGVWLLAIGLAATATLLAQTFPPRPGERDFILDEANLINPQDTQQVKGLCDRLLSEERIPIVVVTIPSLAAYNASNIESYARALFDNWGIGSRRRNLGILLLVSLGDRKARIELGAEWAHTQDETASMIMDKIIIPNFKKGDYSTGILQGVQALETMARGQAVKVPRPWYQPWLTLGLFGLGIFVAISLIRNGKKGWGWALLAVLFAILVFVLVAAARSGGGGSFGGGSGGGGGATGSW